MDEKLQFREIPNLPRNEEGPVFAEPWQLTAFSIVLALHEKGFFQWREWVNYLSAEIDLGKDYGSSDYNTIYYNQWLAALENLVNDKGLSTFDELIARKEEWRHADEHRGFGEPLVLNGHQHDHDHHHDHGHSHSHGEASAKPLTVDKACRAPAQRLSH
ncbi:nitrile hydratase accessory protein [Martelella soudanensis]|uniref:nitrile hydratase accessory protein n=1 Tax=unclassified Martelella TaxID=2629616 RepID=UPI0015DED103|nr:MULTISPECIES: nitrile hydratase accessory protein [unclassified Martelella]